MSKHQFTDNFLAEVTAETNLTFTKSQEQVIKKRLSEMAKDEDFESKFSQDVEFSTGVRSINGSKEPTCLVLSGGAFKGSYEVGFLAYFERLWDHFNIDTVIGTSVGAVNAVALAQDGKAGIKRLIKLWLGLRGDSDMFQQHKSVQDIDKQIYALTGKTLEDLMKENGLEGLKSALLGHATDEIALTGSGVSTAFLGAASGGPIGLLFVGIGTLLGVIGTVDAIETVDNFLKQLENAFKLLMKAPGLYDFVALRKTLLAELKAGSPIGQRDKPKLRLATVRLEDGEICYFTEKRQLLVGHPVRSKGKTWDLSNQRIEDTIADAVLASASPPAFFPAVELKEKDARNRVTERGFFVDGGIREILPLRAAFEMNYKRIVSILTSPPTVPEWKATQSPPPIAEVLTRTLPILLDEVMETDLSEGFRRNGVELISHYPQTEIFEDAFSVDPGLIRINMAYGYMRAWISTRHAAGKNLRNSSVILAVVIIEEIIKARRLAWSLELQLGEQLNRPRVGGMETKTLEKLRKVKKEILKWTDMLYQIDPDAIPVSMEGESVKDWWLSYERHKKGEEAEKLNDLKPFERQFILHPTTKRSVMESSNPRDPRSKHAALR